MDTKKVLTQEQLKAALHYDPLTGVFTRLTGKWRGRVAGTINKQGYRYICFGRADLYRAARLAYLYMEGKWPDAVVDHINGIRSDDRYSNLRPATLMENQQNKKLMASNKSGASNVFYRRDRGKYSVRLRSPLSGRYESFGCYETLEEATEVAAKKKAELHVYSTGLPTKNGRINIEVA